MGDDARDEEQKMTYRLTDNNGYVVASGSFHKMAALAAASIGPLWLEESDGDSWWPVRKVK